MHNTIHSRATALPRILAALFLLSAAAFCQNIDLEYLYEEREDDPYGADLVAQLDDLHRSPVDINSARASDLLRIPFLDEALARRLVAHRRSNGPYATTHALLAVPGFSTELLLAIEPFISLTSPGGEMWVNYSLDISRPLDSGRIRGYREGVYGSSTALRQRLFLNPGQRFKAGIILEKDSGEPGLNDFTALFAAMELPGIGGRIHLGDFSVGFGQRLLLSTSYGASISPNNWQAFKSGGFRLYEKRGSSESGFWRGGYLSINEDGPLSAALMLSGNRIDATTADAGGLVRTIYLSGQHRTESEQLRRNLLAEQTTGIILRLRRGHFDLGTAAVRSSYSHTLALNGRILHGPQSYVSTCYRLLHGNIQLSGEAAFMTPRHGAFQQALYVESDRKDHRSGAIFYYHSPGFWAFYGRTIAQSSATPGNETGFILSHASRLKAHINLAALIRVEQNIADAQFRFLNRTRQLELSRRFKPHLLLVRYTDRWRRGDPPAYPDSALFTQLLRLELVAQPAGALQSRHRLEFSTSRPPNGQVRRWGISLFHSLKWDLTGRTQLQLRWTLFDIPDYEHRIYEFEPDLPASFTNSLLQNEGNKWLILLRHRFRKSGELIVKIREIYYPELQTLGDGLDQLNGNRRRDVRVGFRLER